MTSRNSFGRTGVDLEAARLRDRLSGDGEREGAEAPHSAQVAEEGAELADVALDVHGMCRDRFGPRQLAAHQ